MKNTNNSSPRPTAALSFLKHHILTLLIGLGTVGAGTVLVQAGDGPDMYQTMRQFAPARRAEAPVVQRFSAPLPKIFRSERRALPPQALGFAPVTGAAPAPSRLDFFGERRELPRATPGDEASGDRKKSVRREARRKLRHHDSSSQPGAGLSTATNFCVRACDGFAFPVGQREGNMVVQEATCRSACPGAETLLYTAPAGAKDFDAMTRGGVSYSALPNAFRYREKFDASCRCKAPGSETNPSAYLTDLTLRRGDLVMSRLGFRHFDGSRRLPYRVNNFSDAVSRLGDRREVALVRAMEVASVPGVLSPKAPNYLKERVVSQMKAARAEAQRLAASQRPAANLGRGFTELKAREARGNTVLKTVQRKTEFVALN